MIEIFHVSDLHFGKCDSQNRRSESLLGGISRQFPFTVNDNRYLLVTGDVTDHGKKEEYERATQALLPFADRVFVTPGNHDYGSLWGTDYSERKAQYFDDPFAKGLGFTHSFFDKKVYIHLLQDQSDHWPLMILGLNSCAKEGLSDFAQGEVGEDQRGELAKKLAQYDSQTPKLLFLHHIPNKAAEWEWIMTLRDWDELMAVVRGRVDVLAFGHQGKVMEVNGSKKTKPAQIRPMRVRSIAKDSKHYSKSGLMLLDADGSVDEQKFYRITLDGNRPTAIVVSVAPVG